MFKMAKRIFLTLFLMSIVTGVIGGMTITDAQAHRRYITKNTNSNITIGMCHDWWGPGDLNACGTNAGNRRSIFPTNGYRCTRRIYNDQWDPCFNNFIDWVDTDGFYVSPGWNVFTNMHGVPDGWRAWRLTGWRKYGDCYCWTSIKKVPE